MSSPYPPPPEPQGQPGPQGEPGAGQPGPPPAYPGAAPGPVPGPVSGPPPAYPGAAPGQMPGPMPGQMPGPMPGYPTAMPGMPPAAGAPQPAGPRPASVTTAVRLMWVGAAISLVSALLTPTMGDAMRTQIRDALASSNSAMDPGTFDGFVTVILGVAVVFGIIEVGLWLLMAWQNGKGRTWARIVATVLFALGLLSAVSGLAQAGVAPLLTVLSVANAIVGAVVVFLLWRKESSVWFEAQSAPRY